MIESTLVKFMNQQITSVSTYMEIPEDAPDAFVILEKTGGSETNHVPVVTIAIQSYADSLYSAASLNELVKSAMKVFADRTDVCYVHLNSDYNYTDVTTKKYRYQAVFEIMYY